MDKRNQRLTSNLLLNLYKQKGAKQKTDTMPLFGSPVSLKSKNLVKDESLYVDPDTKDSGYSEDNREDVLTLISSPLTSEDTILAFPTEGIDKSSIGTPNLITKKRLWFNSPTQESPSVITANGLKKLRLFDFKDDLTQPQNESFSNIPEESAGALFEEEESVVPQSCNSQSLYALNENRQEVVKKAVEKSATEELIGDFSMSHALPLVTGSHPDLKCIAPETLKQVIDGKFNNIVDSFKVCCNLVIFVFTAF